jgi:hypothetical protein
MEHFPPANSKIAKNVAKRLKRCMSRRGRFCDHVSSRLCPPGFAAVAQMA